MADAGQARPEKVESAPFPADELRVYMEGNAAAVRATGVEEFGQVADSLDQIVTELPALSADLEALEQRLTVLEQRLIALARSRQTEEQALEARRDLEAHLRPWRSKMTAPQISMLETQYMDRSTLAAAGLPRLSLFYLR